MLHAANSLLLASLLAPGPSIASGSDGRTSDLPADSTATAPSSSTSHQLATGALHSVQEAYIKASNTDVADKFGSAVAISGDTAIVGAFLEDSGATGVNGNQGDESVSQAGAVYVFVRDGGGWAQQAYLKASNTGIQDYFGGSLAISGDTIVVGASGESSDATGVNGDQTDNSADFSGAAYVFVRTGTTWSQQAYLKASNTDAWTDRFGGAVAICGDTIVVGSSAEASAATGVNGNQSDNSAPASGAAYVFVRTGTTWSQQAYLKASNTDGASSVGIGDRFGQAVSVSMDTVAIGAPGEGSDATGVDGDQTSNAASRAGAVYVFERSGTQWAQTAYIKASNTDASDAFGNSVSVSADTLLVGSPHEASAAYGVHSDQADNTVPAAGAAYVFLRSVASWGQIA